MGLRGDFHRRRISAEWMDAPDLDADELGAALRGLERINWFSRAAAVFWPPIEALARRTARRDLRILDIATGAGDIPRALAARARRAGYDFTIECCDINEASLIRARARAAEQDVAVSFFRLDALREPLPRADVILCSLFLHHLSDEQTAGLLARMAGAADGLMMAGDLRRGRSGWALAAAGARLLSGSRVVHNDACRSVEAAFTINEIRALAGQAGLGAVEIRKKYPRRFLLVHRTR